MDENETLQQTKVPKQLIQQIKTYAVKQDLYMKTLQEQIVFYLIQKRKSMKAQGQELVYLASPSDGKSLNVTLKKPVLEAVQKIAEMDRTKVRRVLYTAFYHFAKDYHLDELEVSA